MIWHAHTVVVPPMFVLPTKTTCTEASLSVYSAVALLTRGVTRSRDLRSSSSKDFDWARICEQGEEQRTH